MMESINAKTIVGKLKDEGILDYHFLAQPAVLALCKEILTQLLEEAENDFEGMLKEEKVTFEKIVGRYFNNGLELELLYGFLHHLNSNDGGEETRETIEFFQPKYVAFYNRISLSSELYLKLIAVNGGDEKLNTEQKRSLELLIRNLEMAGVHLEGKKKKKLEEINLKLAKLAQDYSNHVTDSRNKFYYQFTSDETIKDLPEQELETAKREAETRKLKGWVFTLSPPSLMAVMKYCSDRKVREIFYQESVQVATKDENDNQPLVLEILKLRKEKAKLLGFKNYVDFVLQERMAGTVDQISLTVGEIEERARKKAKIDVEELAEFASGAARADSSDFKIQPWDVSFYANKLKKEKFEIDAKKLKEYFELEKVLAGMFGIAKDLYGVEMKPIEMKSYDDEVRSYEVYREGNLIAYFVLDLFARRTKRPGAWCNTLRSRRKIGDNSRLPIVANVANFGKASSADSPSLLSHDEVLTMFHEYGHALHMILSQTDYPNTSSSNVEWDFVELPSQLFENWCWRRESLDRFVAHYETGEPLEEKLFEKLKASRTFMSGYNVLRQLSFLNLDLQLHTHADFGSVEEVNEFCLDLAKKYSQLEVPEYYRMQASFSHIFAGGYAAGYYSYIWAEILEADVFKKFEQEGILNPKVGREFEVKVLMKGTLKPGSELFEDFMGRGPKVEALMEKLGI